MLYSFLYTLWKLKSTCTIFLFTRKIHRQYFSTKNLRFEYSLYEKWGFLQYIKLWLFGHQFTAKTQIRNINLAFAGMKKYFFYINK